MIYILSFTSSIFTRKIDRISVPPNLSQRKEEMKMIGDGWFLEKVNYASSEN
jgi:hypothetical protein